MCAVQSSGLPDLSGSGDHSYRHYRIGKDIVLRLEAISPKETKVCTRLTSLSDAAAHIWTSTSTDELIALLT